MRLLLRFFLGLIILFSISNCDRFKLNKKELNQTIDTVINFSEVDVSPTFKVCDSLIDKAIQNDCFRKTIHQEVMKNLSQQQFEVSTSIDEKVVAIITIDREGAFRLKALKSDAIITKELPKLDSLLAVAIENLPKVFPAIKRGIPVATQYELPIQIKVAE